MAIYDVDMTSGDRSNPNPEVPDLMHQRNAHLTNSTSYSPTNSVPNGARVQQKNNAIIANNGTTNKALFGYNPGLGKWGSFVAKEGIDVATNTDPANLIFNSEQNVFKIVSTLNVIFPTATANFNNSTVSAAATTTIPHGLNYVPILTGVITVLGGYLPLPWIDTYPIQASALGNFNTTMLRVVADATNIYLMTKVVSSGTGSGSTTDGGQPAKIYILQESAN